MKPEIDIYGYPRHLELAIKRLERAPISERNKELILGIMYYNANRALNCSGICQSLKYFFGPSSYKQLVRKGWK